MKLMTTALLWLGFSFAGLAQATDANIFGDVKSNGEHVPFVTVYLEGTTFGTTTDVTGHYLLVNLPTGEFTLVAQALGYRKQSQKVVLEKGRSLEVNFDLAEEVISLDDVVITGTKTFKRQTDSPVIVSVMDAKTMNRIQVNTLSEGLMFQPGLRLETDCQTCNYTQLRMNGLGGAYSQVLINSRPIFSPLTGLYGLEQIPSSMIERIEVVRGGGSALYGSSAIGGTVNVITRMPTRNAYELTVNQGLVGHSAWDSQLTGNLSVLSGKRNAGLSLFATRRSRAIYDRNGDGFSELPGLTSNSFGFTTYVKPGRGQKIEVSLSSLHEYRYGGEITDLPAHEALQSEERTHNVLMGSIDYEIDFNGDNSSLILYAAGQDNKRRHYTGIIPDDSAGILRHLLNPPYGRTQNNTLQAGVQVNHRMREFPLGPNILTGGAELYADRVDDRISAYRYHLDQTAQSTGIFLQSDWRILHAVTLLTGVRADRHNLLDRWVVNPRVSLLWKAGDHYQFRASYGTGFRAPQAFDADMHFSFAGGGVSRISLSPGLGPEYSSSVNGSVNYDKPTEHYIYGFTAEGFYTRLRNTFVLEEVGRDEFGLMYEKRNSSGSSVYGGTVEVRANYRRKVQLEAGITLQRSRYEEPVEMSDDLSPVEFYLRSPDAYGFATLTLTPDGKFSGAVTGVFTGPMTVLHVAGSPELPTGDAFVTTKSFADLGLRIAYSIASPVFDSDVELFAGVKNLLDAYQDDFDTGKNRDSNYIYGPAAPRTLYFGLRLRSL